MTTAVKRILSISRAIVLAAVLAFAALTVHADGFGARSTLDGPAGSLLSGARACQPALEDGLSEGSGCMAGWAVNHLLLDAVTHFATSQGQALFDEQFRIVNTMSFSPSEGRVGGALDVVLPLASSTLPSATPSGAGALFMQQGLTRWVDDHGLDRNDFRLGLVRRLDLSDEDAAPGIFGVSAFVQQSREFQHTRLVAGTDYASKWGRGSLNLFIPTTGWKAAQTGYEERALAGIELGFKVDLTTTLSTSTAVGQWEKDDGFGGWSTNGRMAVGWRPHPWLDFGVAWNGIGTLAHDKVVRVGFSMPLGGTRTPPRWEGLGLATGGPGSSDLDLWKPVENIGAIQVARRSSESDQLVSGATVRFLQDSANTGDQIDIEVSLTSATPNDLNLVVTLAPGTGDDPAVPAVDFVDEPIPVTIRAGASSAVVTVQLPLNAQLDETRSLRATLALAS